MKGDTCYEDRTAKPKLLFLISKRRKPMKENESIL